MEPPVTLEQCRMNIDYLDEKIVELLKERFTVSARIAEYKQTHNVAVTDGGREEKVKERVRSLCGEHAYTDRIVELYDSLMAQSRKLQRKMIGNIYLIGMPGCGKTTIGKELAGKLGRSFIDADDFFEYVNGSSPSEVIGSEGEGDFRRKESEVLKTIAASQRSVIALGGGVVTVEKNREILGEDCLIIYIKRSLDRLETKGRPLSMQKGVKELFEKRQGFYESWADMSVDNDGECEETVEKLIRML